METFERPNIHDLLLSVRIINLSDNINREITIRQGAVRRQTGQWVDWIEYFVFRANFDRYERAHTVRTSLARTARPHTNAFAQSVR